MTPEKIKNIINKSAFFIFLAVIVIGCSKTEEQKPVSEKTEEVTDTGVLMVDSYPGAAQIYIDGELKGGTPFTLYNFPVGQHEVMVKKDGYEDFKKTVTIVVGRTEEIKATLSQIEIAATTVATEENKSAAEKSIENASLSPSKLNSVNVSSSFSMYYDFKNALFTETASATPDIFSANYNTYIYFTAYSLSQMRIVNKQIKDAKKEDCINAVDTIANLYSGQTLCVKTTNGLTAAIGGIWKNSPSELQWVLFS